MPVHDDGDLSYGLDENHGEPEPEDECVRCYAPARQHDLDSEPYCDECAKHWGNW